MAVQINVAANQAALTASIQAGVQAYNQRFAQNNQINLSINQRGFSQPLGRITGDVKDFEAALAASNARVIAFGASTAVLGGVIRSFKELANVTIEVEKNLADINRVFGLTTSQLQKFSTDLFNVTKLTASSFNDASQAALEFSRQGLKAEETLQRTKDALTLTRLAGISTANAVDALTSTVNGFAATGISTTQILNKLVAVEQDYAVGAGDLAEALSRTGQAAQEAGVSLDQLNALVTSAQQSTARGGAVIGNALKTIFTRLQRTDTLDQLEAFNISVRDVQGNILPAVQILQNFAGAYKGLADAQRAQLSEQVAGVYQVNILKAIVNDLNKSQGTYAGALQRGAAATNEAEVATAKLNQTLDALLKQTATSTQQLANNIGKVTFEPLAKYGTEQLKSFIESLNEVLEGEGVGSTFANGLLKGIRNVIAGPGAIAAFFTLFKLIQNSFTYLSQALPQIAGITTETQNRKNIEQSILQIMQQQGPVSQALAGTMGNQAAQAQLLLQLARQQTAEYQMQTTLAKQLAVQLAGQGVRVKGSGGLQVTRAGGYIPNATKMAEVVGAQAGGYTPGRVVSSPVGGVMNTAEDIKYIPGFAQPFINPPAGSKAGRAHRQNAINRTGVDPYMHGGFIPNFVNKKGINPGERGNQFEKLINKSLTGVESQAGSELLDFPFGKNSLNSASLIDKNRISLNSNTFFGDAKIKSTKETQRDLVKKLVGSLDSFTYGKLITRANKVKSHIINLNDFLPIKPSLISNKSVVTSDKENASVEAVLGFDVIEKLARLYKNNKNTERLTTEIAENTILKLNFIDDYVTIPDFSNSGFVPNFATPMTTASIPWFKKYSSKYKNASGDTDLFKMGDFPTYGRGLDHEYAKKGNSAMLSYLHEDFVRSALNIALGSKKVIRPAEVGFKNKPVSDIANENDFDLLYRIADGSYSMLELKQDFKNVSGSVTGFMNKKFANLEKENPVLAKKVSSMIAVSNRPKFTDPTGKNPAGQFSEFEMAAASIVKDKYSNVDPSISAKLTKVTDGLLRRYEVKKNSYSKGFIPNFAYKQAVMGLEESVSGNKAIFDTKPFPHIRNSSQPTFSSAIADHGGLGNALSDSMRGQKAAGLMSGGLIPNFAAFGPSYSYMPSGTPSGSSAYYPSGNPNASQRVSPIYAPQQSNVSGRAGNLIFNNDDIEKATQGFVDTVQKADAKLSIFERIFGGRNKLIDSELLKLKTTLSNNGVQGQALSDAMNKASKIIQNEPSKFAKNLASAGTAISLAGPMIAGLAEQAFFGNKERTDLTENERMGKSALSTGLSAISTGVGIGASFGPLGSAIGGTVGALIGLTSSLDAARLSADELMQLSEKQSQKAQENIQASSSYIESQKQLTDLISKGASSTEIETATENLAKNFNLIKDTKLQEIFLSAGGNVDVMTQQLKQYTEQVVKQGARERGLFGDKMTLNERTSALTVGIGREKLPSFIEDLKKGIEDAREAYTNFDDEVGAFQKDAARNRARREGFIPAAKKILKDQGYQETDTNYKSQLNQLLEVLDTTAENLIKSLNESLNIIDLSKIFANFNKKATESYSAIFERIANNLQKQNFDLEKRFISATGENKIQNTILEFSTGLNSFLDSFLSDTLDEFSKLQMAPQVATRKYTEGLNKIQLNNNKFQIDQEKAKNDFLEKNASKLTDTFKSSILQSQQNAQYFESTLLPQIQQGNYNFDLSRVLKDLNQQNLDQAKRTISESGIQGLETLDLTSTGGRELGLKILTNEAKTLGEGSEKAAEKIAAAVNAINSLSKSAEFLTNTNAQKSIGYALKTATQEKTNFDANQKYLEEENRIRSSFEAARLKAETDLSVKRAEVDKGILLRLRAMRELVDELQVRSAISAARGSAQAQLTEARVQDPFRILGQGVRSNTEETIRLENQAIQERRKVEDATLNDQIQQAAIEIATREANTTALEGLTNAVFELTSNILKEQMGGSYEDMKGNPFINESYSSNFNPTEQNLEKFSRNNYTPEQISAFKAYQQLQQQRPSSLGGYNFSEYKKQLSEINPNRKLTQDQITGISKNFQSRAKELGVTENEANRLMEDQQTLSIYQQLETIRNKALESKTKESDKIAEDARALQNRLIKEKDILDIQRAIGDQIKKNTDEYKRMQSTFSGNFVIGVANLRTQSEEIINNLGRDLPRMFGDGLVDGIKAAIRESDNLGDALMGVASKFLDEISTAMMRSAIYGILGNIGMGIPGISNAAAAGGMKQKGGYIRAQSGMYISGTGSGDKYPALLENGEYVLNRKAVMAMGGPAALDTLNFSAAPRFAAGGSFGNNFSDISSMESNMTTYGLEQSQLYNELRDSERQKQQEGIRKRQQRKAERNAMIGSIIAAVATAAVAAGVSNVASNVKATNAQKLSAKVQATGGAGMTNSEMGKLASYQKSGLLGKNFEYIGGTPQTGFGSIFSGPTIGKTWYQKAGSSITKPFGRRQAGGYIGSRLSDTIPAYATGGLVDMPIVKRYAVGGNVSAQRINNGAGNNSTVNNNTSASNSFNFNTTVQRDGKIEIGSNMTSYSQQDVELSQSLNTKVYEVVLDTIRKEKRFGGSLAGTRNA